MEIDTIKKQIKSILIGENIDFIEKNDISEIVEFLNNRIKINIKNAEKELFISSNGKYNKLDEFYYNQKEFQTITHNFTNLILQNNLLVKNLLQLNQLQS